MIAQKSSIWRGYIEASVLFAFCWTLLAYVFDHIGNDFVLHLQHVVNINAGEAVYPANFLFYYLVNLFTGFSSDMSLLRLALLGMLSLALTAKFCVSRAMLLDQRLMGTVRLNGLQASAAAMALFFFFAVPDLYGLLVLKTLYVARLVPTVWHNSTILFVLPFALMLFWQHYRLRMQDIAYSNRDIALAVMLVIINIIIKPSFLFVFIPMAFLFELPLLKRGEFRLFFRHISPLFIGLLLIALQYVLLFVWHQGAIEQDPSGLALGVPFQAYLKWMDLWYLPIAFAFSLALPVCTILVCREVLAYRPFVFSLAMLAFGVLISALIVETGPRANHGNFFWQIVPACYCLFVSNVIFLIPKFIGLQKLRGRQLFLALVALAHVMAGGLYIVKIIATGVYH